MLKTLGGEFAYCISAPTVALKGQAFGNRQDRLETTEMNTMLCINE